MLMLIAETTQLMLLHLVPATKVTVHGTANQASSTFHIKSSNQSIQVIKQFCIQYR
jgi:hypothetical protein